MAIEESSAQKTLDVMRQKLGHIIPDAELRLKSELVYEINRLKKERGALILGHNYMEAALFYGVPDYVGDSLGLAREAANTDCDPIIFCGVRFMAETAKILNPTKTVLLPAKEAGCSLAESISVEDVRELRALFPEATVVCYVNTYADIKAEIDICCTSSNAARVIQSLPQDKPIIFIPDEYLSKNVAQETGRDIVIAERDDTGAIQFDKRDKYDLIGWRGSCEVHERFSVDDISNARRQFDDIEVIVHPECKPEVVQAADFSGSTTALVRYVKESKAKRLLVLTECSMGDNIIAQNPEKEVIRLCSIRCPHMNQITLEDTLHALTHNEQVIEVDEEIRVKALTSVERMLAI